jgi:NitT/TauT family transport system ATP-binding protein
MTEWIQVTNARIAFGGFPVFHNLCFAVPNGAAAVALVGRSGAGKTTLIRLLAGHLKADDGSIIVCGDLVTRPSPMRPVVFQDHNLFPWKTALENAAFGLRCAGVGRLERESRARAVLDWLGLRDSSQLLPFQLSVGMQQRVGLARALAVAPHCVLMDEPLSALDSETRLRLATEIRRLRDEHELRLVIATHDLEEAVFISDLVLILDGIGGATMFSIDLDRGRPSIRTEPKFREIVEELRSTLYADSRRDLDDTLYKGPILTEKLVRPPSVEYSSHQLLRTRLSRWFRF